MERRWPPGSMVGESSLRWPRDEKVSYPSLYDQDCIHRPVSDDSCSQLEQVWFRLPNGSVWRSKSNLNLSSDYGSGRFHMPARSSLIPAPEMRQRRLRHCLSFHVKLLQKGKKKSIDVTVFVTWAFLSGSCVKRDCYLSLVETFCWLQILFLNHQLYIVLSGEKNGHRSKLL